MKQYFYEKKAVELNKPFTATVCTDNCSMHFETKCLTPELADVLVTRGILTAEFEDTPTITFSACIDYLAAKNRWSADKTCSFLDKVGATCSASALSMIAKAAAVLIDKRYKGHIADSPEIWCISFVDWNVHPINKSIIKDYVNFSAFRNKEDALEALKMLKSLRHE